MHKKNILEVCLSPDLGGLELFAYNCYRDFSTRSKTFFALQKEKKLDNYFEDEKKLYLQRSKMPLMSAWKMAKFIDKEAIDILHFHWTKDILMVVLAKTLSRRKPKIVQSRHMRMTRFKSDVYHKWLYKNIALMHAVTKEVAKQLARFIPKEIAPKIESIYLGVAPKELLSAKELQRLYAKKEDEFLVGIVGRIEEAKGQERLIEALKELPLNVKLLVVGAAMSDEYLRYLKIKVHELGLDERVVFVGFTKEVDAYMQLCDVTVMATENETFGLVVIESMANHTPVIAKNMGGPLEIIEDGVDGLFFDGSAADLAQKIAMLYEDRELLERLRERALAKVKREFDFSKQLEKLYKVIIDES